MSFVLHGVTETALNNLLFFSFKYIQQLPFFLIPASHKEAQIFLPRPVKSILFLWKKFKPGNGCQPSRFFNELSLRYKGVGFSEVAIDRGYSSTSFIYCLLVYREILWFWLWKYLWFSILRFNFLLTSLWAFFCSWEIFGRKYI